MKARKKKNQSSRLAKKENILYKQMKGYHTRYSIEAWANNLFTS